MKRQPRILAGTAIGLLMASAPLGAFPLSGKTVDSRFAPLILVVQSRRPEAHRLLVGALFVGLQPGRKYVPGPAVIAADARLVLPREPSYGEPEVHGIGGRARHGPARTPPGPTPRPG